ncbi:cytochrome P450 family protein [Rhizoctonia solani]|uniref:Cytochrome P450 family protein n=1 Tax=Rhizoctonia solani TaxID=456999 RepID=A0A8H8NYU7_9AGAM|nr:cytochrome P450 family protein [Rhizoctonia solani]QRW20828.1 cytochrome P450 family protein [Rhizoctonia solani]
MSTGEAQTIEELTTAISTQGQPDAKTRRYDRQLRLWATAGQNALESARILVVGSTATSSSIMKNLVLPGIGHFTIMDHRSVSSEDVGNNFFLEYSSIGKPRAEEAIRLLSELNDSVEGVANTSNIEEVLEKDPAYITGFTLVIAHNLPDGPLRKLASLLWSNVAHPPLVVVRTAGFLADFTIQLHEHAVVDSHSETAPSLRIDKPFPELLEHSLSLDFPAMDPTDHGHVPYVYILVRAMHDWKAACGVGMLGYHPKRFTGYGDEGQIDEENFDEAVAQAYRAWTLTDVPRDIQALFADEKCTGYLNAAGNGGVGTSQFWALLRALHLFTAARAIYWVQAMYKRQADAERKEYIGLLREVVAQTGQRHVEGDGEVPGISDDAIEWGALRPDAIAQSLAIAPSGTATFAALGTRFAFETTHGRSPTPGSDEDYVLLEQCFNTLIGGDAGEEGKIALGELHRAPTAELPTTAALVGGLVAQEAIKVITRQYIPIDGTCIIDLVSSTTATIKVACLCALVIRVISWRIRRGRLPAGPPAHPIWGHVDLVKSPRLHLIAAEWTKSFGNLVTLHFMGTNTVIINSAADAVELLDKRAASTSGRPREVMMGDVMGYNTSVGLHQPDERFRKLRRVMASAMHATAVRSYQPIEVNNVKYMLRRMAGLGGSMLTNNDKVNTASVNQAMGVGHPASSAQPMSLVREAATRFILNVAYGHEVKPHDPFIGLIHAAMMKIREGKYPIVEAFPWLVNLPRWLPGTRFLQVGAEGHALREAYAGGHSSKLRPKWFFRIQFLAIKGGPDEATAHDQDLIKWTASAIFVGGSDTGKDCGGDQHFPPHDGRKPGRSKTCAGRNRESIRSQRSYSGAPATAGTEGEVSTNACIIPVPERLPGFEDRHQLPYLEAVFKEVMRINPGLSMGLPHAVTQEEIYHGYTFPVGTIIRANLWAILHDPALYSSPHTFEPKRHLGPHADPNPLRYVFGFGRRICPGVHLAADQPWLAMAGILSTFNVVGGKGLIEEAKLRTMGYV